MCSDCAPVVCPNCPGSHLEPLQVVNIHNGKEWRVWQCSECRRWIAADGCILEKK